MSAKTNIEVLSQLLDLYRSSPFNFLLVPPIDHSLHTSCLQTWGSFGRILNYIINNGVSVKSSIASRIYRIINQYSSLTCGWSLIWMLYCTHYPHLGGFNTNLDVDMATLYIQPHKDFIELYSRTLTIQNNIELSKTVISPNLLIKCYIELLMSCPTIIAFLAEKKALFTSLLSIHANHHIYKSDSITSITKFLEKCNFLAILNPYSQIFNTHPIISYCKYP